MPTTREYERALIVSKPHGDDIASGAKTALIKTQRYNIEAELILVVQNKQAVGLITLSEPTVLSLADFRRDRGAHRVSAAGSGRVARCFTTTTF